MSTISTRTRVTISLALALLAIVPGSAAAAGIDVRWAERQAGLHEIGTSNCSPKIDTWTRHMGLPARPCRPWCGTFVHEAARRGGISLSKRFIDPDRVYDDVIHNRRHLRRIAPQNVRRGDIVLYKFREGVRASHIEIVRGRVGSDGRIPVVGGNVGHTVKLNRRGVQYVVVAARASSAA